MHSAFCPSIKEFTIQQGTTEIGDYVLDYSPSLTKLVVADSVILIGSGFARSSHNLPCIFWAGPQGISIEDYQYSMLSRKPICAVVSPSSLPTSSHEPSHEPSNEPSYEPSECPQGYTFSGDFNKCYRGFSDRLNWLDAQNVCRGYGGQLVVIQSF